MTFFSRLQERLQAGAESAGPVRGTYSMIRMLMIWLAANLVVTTLLTGTLLVPDVQFPVAMWLIVLGTVLGAMVLVAVGMIGTKTGLPTMAITRASFGIRGSLAPTAINLILLMGWSWVQAMLAGISLNWLVEYFTGFSSPLLFALISQTVVVSIGILGHTAVARVEPWLAVAIVGICAYVAFVAFTSFSPGEFAAIPAPAEPTLTSGLVFDIVLATAISWTVLSADLNRYAKTPRGGAIGSGIGYTLSTVVSMATGATAIAYVTLRGGDAVPFDPSTIIEPFGPIFAFAIFLSVMATNSMVVFGMATTVINAMPERRIPFLPTALVLGVVSIAGASLFGLLDQFTTFLITIGALFAPIFAIMIVDFYLLQRGSYGRDILLPKGGRYWYFGGINLIAMGAWAVGAVCAYIWTYVAPLPIGATLASFAVTFVIYLVASSVAGRRRDQEAARHLLDEVAPAVAA